MCWQGYEEVDGVLIQTEGNVSDCLELCAITEGCEYVAFGGNNGNTECRSLTTSLKASDESSATTEWVFFALHGNDC